MLSSMAPQLSRSFTQLSISKSKQKQKQVRRKGQTFIYELLEFINGLFRDDPHCSSSEQSFLEEE